MERRKTALLLFLLLLIPLNVFAQPSQTEDSPRHISISFLQPSFRKDEFTRRYDVISVEGTNFLMRPGYPMIPVKVLVIKLQAGIRVASVRVDASYSEIPGEYEIMPAPEPQPLQPRNVTPPIIVPNPEVYSKPEFYPAEHFSYFIKRGFDPYTMQDVTYLTIFLYPIKFLPTEGKILFSSTMEVSIEYEGSPEPVQYEKKLAIITSDSLIDAANTLRIAREGEGWTVEVITVEQINLGYSGVDLQEKIRNYIKGKKDDGYAFFTILGDVDQVPVRLAYIPDGYDDSDDPNYTGDGSYVETDLYYADLDGNWNADGDDKWGEYDNDSIDGVPDVMIGRLPASTLTEANDIVQKVINYSPQNSWFMKYLFLGTITFGDPLFPEGQILKDTIEYYILPSDFYWKKLYEQTGDLTGANVQSEINSGYGFVNFAGHGWPGGWYLGDNNWYYDANASSLINGNNLPVIFTMACSTSRFYDTDSIGEKFLLNPNGGAIAYFGASRVAWGYIGQWVTQGLAGKMDLLFNINFFDLYTAGTPYLGAVWSESITDYILENSISWLYDWKTVAEYGTMFGDPSVMLVGEGAGPSPPPEPILYGYVSSLSGTSVSDAIVSVYSYTTNELIDQTTTDASGYYEFIGLPPGTFFLKVQADGYYEMGPAFYYPRKDIEVDVKIIEKPLPPNTVLLVVDDDGCCFVDWGVWPEEIKTPIESLGLNVFVYNESEFFEPPLEMLLDAVVVFWHTGTYWGWAVSPSDAQTLMDFVNAGGFLILEGEDIGFDHVDDDFMVEVAHAILGADDAGSSVLNVTIPWHLIAEGLSQTFSFTTYPPYPDGVYPTNGGYEVISYNGTVYTAVTAFGDIGSTGCRVVYFSFPLHYLYQTERDLLVQNSIRWVLGGDYEAPVLRRVKISVENGILTVNMTFSSTNILSSMEYSLDNQPFVQIDPVDGSCDEVKEDLTIALDGSALEEGMHYLEVQVTDVAGNSFSYIIKFHSTPLKAGWNLVALALEPSSQITADDLGGIIGPSCTVISRWEEIEGKYYSYLPGISPEVFNFEIKLGRGYFVFLISDGVLISSEGMGGS